VKVGDIVKFHSSRRRNGKYAEKIGLVVDLDAWENPTVSINDEIKSFHYTQIEKVINESR